MMSRSFARVASIICFATFSFSNSFDLISGRSGSINDLQNSKTDDKLRGQLEGKNLRNFTLVVGTDWDYMDIFLNSIISLHRFGKYNFVAQCYDAKSCKYLKEAGFSVYDDDMSRNIASAYFSSSTCPKLKGHLRTHAKVMYMRINLYKHILSQGQNILMVDADTCWAHPPENIFIDDEYDMVFAAHLGEFKNIECLSFMANKTACVRINSGLAYIRNTPFTVHDFFPKAYAKSLKTMCERGYAQTAVARQLFESGLIFSFHQNTYYLKGKIPGAKVRTIPFPSYLHPCVDDEFPQPARNVATAIHANCCIPDKKVAFMKSKDCWLLRDDWATVRPSGNLEEFLPKLYATPTNSTSLQ